MDDILNSTAAIVALIAAGVFFMTGLLTGVWKYTSIMGNEKSEAPYYVNIAHRAALLYAYAALLIAVFAALSAFSPLVNLLATIAPLFFFGLAILLYVQLGLKNETDNQFRDAPNRGTIKILMTALIIAEIGGFGILFAGFIWRLVA